MLRRKTLLFFAILLVVAAGFGASKVMAFNDNNEAPPESLTISGWTVELVSVGAASDGNYDWHYRIANSSGTASSLNFAAMLIPDCESGEKISVNLRQSSGFTDYFEVGAGEPTLNFGSYNQQARVAKGNADSQTAWHLIANTNVKTGSTILLKIKKIGAVPFEMAGPGCFVPVNEEVDEEIFESAEEFTYVNAAGRTFIVTVKKNQDGEITQILRTCRDVDGDLCPNTFEDEDITHTKKTVDKVLAKFPKTLGDEETTLEPFNYVPNGTITKSGEDSTCGYWYNGMFWDFCSYSNY